MAKQTHVHLSRREREIMDIVYTRGLVSVHDVMQKMSDPPSYSAVRAMLRLLEEKGHLVHEQDGPRYVYKPTVPREKARQSASASRRTSTPPRKPSSSTLCRAGVTCRSTRFAIASKI